MDNFLYQVIIQAPPFVIAIVLHEIAHGYAAFRLGDPTAKNLGRLTLNPIKHVDPFLTIGLPLLLVLANSPVIFGGAKPVPVHPGYFRNPRQGMVIVAAAGPLTNLVLAALTYGLLVLAAPLPGAVPPILQAGLVFVIYPWLIFSLLINLILALFNLLPIPPLDGGRIAVGLLPRALAIPLAKLEPYGFLIVFALLYFGVVGQIIEPILRFVGRFVHSGM